MNPTERKQWLAERKSGLGGTDIASICGVGFGNPLTVYQDKTTTEIIDEEVHPLLQIGLATERMNVEMYCKKMGLVYGEDVRKPTPIVRHKSAPYAFASLDFETADAVPVETKYTILFGDARWGEEMTDQVPFGYVTQGQWQLGCNDGNHQDLSVLSGAGEHRIYRVGRDVRLIGLLLEIGGEFWDKFVRTQTPPPLDWMPPAREAFTERLIAVEREKRIVLGDDAAKLADEFVRLKEIVKDAEIEIDEKQQQLEILMGDAGKALAGDVRLSRWIVPETIIPAKEAYPRKAYSQFRATKIKPSQKGKLL
ncbi:MAG: YqaJ viral recombinase family protein [Gemmataceae bacterium]